MTTPDDIHSIALAAIGEVLRQLTADELATVQANLTLANRTAKNAVDYRIGAIAWAAQEAWRKERGDAGGGDSPAKRRMENDA